MRKEVTYKVTSGENPRVYKVGEIKDFLEDADGILVGQLKMIAEYVGSGQTNLAIRILLNALAEQGVPAVTDDINVAHGGCVSIFHIAEDIKRMYA